MYHGNNSNSGDSGKSFKSKQGSNGRHGHHQKKVADRQMMEAAYIRNIGGNESPSAQLYGLQSPSAQQQMQNHYARTAIEVNSFDIGQFIQEDPSSGFKTVPSQVIVPQGNDLVYYTTEEMFGNDSNAAIQDGCGGLEMRGPEVQSPGQDRTTPHRRSPGVVASPPPPPAVRDGPTSPSSPKSLLSPSPVRSPAQPSPPVSSPRRQSPSVLSCVPQHVQPVEPAPTVRSRGKGIKFNDGPPTSPRVSDAESDEDENADADLPSVTRVREVYENTYVPDNKEDVAKELKTYMNRRQTEEGEDLFRIDDDRVKVLVTVGRFVDKQYNNGKFAIGFNLLFDETLHEVPDLKAVFDEIRSRESFVDVLRVHVPKSIRWLFVQTAVCYHRYADQRKESCLGAVANAIKKMKSRSALQVLNAVSSFNWLIEKTIKRKQVGDRIHEPSFVEPPSPAPAPKRRKKHYEEDEDGGDSDTASIISRASSTTTNHQNWRARKNTPSTFKPVVSFSPSCEGISYVRTTQAVWQTTIRTATPNVYLSNATKDVVSYVLRQQKRSCHGITFSDVLQTLTDGITNGVFGKSMTNVGEVCSKMEGIDDVDKKTALKVCVSLRSLALTVENNDYPRVEFDAMMGWCQKYCASLLKSLCDASQRIDRTALETRNLKDEYFRITGEVERDVSTHCQRYTEVFRDLGAISDWCLYAIFGVSLNKDGDGIDTSVLVKSILSAWTMLRKMPVDLKTEDVTGLKKLFWCMPLAYLTRFGDFGKPTVVEQTELEFDDFLKECMK